MQPATSAKANTRTPERSCFYEAECEVDGRRYAARSRHGAANELARVLVSAGVPDQPVEVRHTGLKGCVSYPSLHEMAGWTYEESAGVSLRRVRWKPLPDFTAAGQGRIAQNRGETPPPVGEEPAPVSSALGQRGEKAAPDHSPNISAFVSPAMSEGGANSPPIRTTRSPSP